MAKLDYADQSVKLSYSPLPPQNDFNPISSTKRGDN